VPAHAATGAAADDEVTIRHSIHLTAPPVEADFFAGSFTTHFVDAMEDKAAQPVGLADLANAFPGQNRRMLIAAALSCSRWGF
jgi:hypothetical protein